MISDERRARMIDGRWTSNDLDEVFKELQARRAVDAELMTVIRRHAESATPNGAAVFCSQVARQQDAGDQFTTHLYLLVPQIVDALCTTCADYCKVAQDAVAVSKPPVYIVATQEQIDKIKGYGIGSASLGYQAHAPNVMHETPVYGPSGVEAALPLLIAKDKATTDATHEVPVSIELAPGWSEQSVLRLGENDE